MEIVVFKDRFHPCLLTTFTLLENWWVGESCLLSTILAVWLITSC